MHHRQVLVPISEMVLAKLSGGIAERLEQFGNRRVFLLQPERGAWQPNLGHAGAQAGLPCDERSTSGRTALFGIVVGEHHAFICDAVDIGRLESHQAARVGADVGLANVIAPDDDNVGFASRRGRGLLWLLCLCDLRAINDVDCRGDSKRCARKRMLRRLNALLSECFAGVSTGPLPLVWWAISLSLP
jgi:hypothetical protein